MPETIYFYIYIHKTVNNKKSTFYDKLKKFCRLVLQTLLRSYILTWILLQIFATVNFIVKLNSFLKNFTSIL